MVRNLGHPYLKKLAGSCKSDRQACLTGRRSTGHTFDPRMGSDQLNETVSE